MSRYTTAARRRWPRAAWITGDGRHASIAYCGTTTVMLFTSRTEADEAKASIDRFACGHDCRRQHEIIDLGEAASR